MKNVRPHFVERHARVQDKYKKTRTVSQNFAEFFSNTILTQYAYRVDQKRNNSVQLSKCRGFVTVAYKCFSSFACRFVNVFLFIKTLTKYKKIFKNLKNVKT